MTSPAGERPSIPSRVYEQVDCFSRNAFYTVGIDARSLYGQAIGMAKALGYSDEVCEAVPFAGVALASGDNAGELYVPGIKKYAPQDHVRGITRTVAESALQPEGKAILINHVIDMSSRSPRLHTYGGHGALRQRNAARLAIGELRGIQRSATWPEVTSEVADIRSALSAKRHPFWFEVAHAMSDIDAPNPLGRL